MGLVKGFVLSCFRRFKNLALMPLPNPSCTVYRELEVFVHTRQPVLYEVFLRDLLLCICAGISIGKRLYNPFQTNFYNKDRSFKQVK